MEIQRKGKSLQVPEKGGGRGDYKEGIIKAVAFVTLLKDE